MRKIRVNAPNFRCRVIDHHDKTITWIGYAESKEELESRLRRGFKDVVRIKPFDLGRWRNRAQIETGNVIKWRRENRGKKTGEYSWRDTVWKYLKVYLFSVTNGKCAFCETDALTVSPGDVEHYRPKAAVEGDETHMGYYWLAYSVENYLPSCGNCNSSGKMNKFPVSGTRAYAPDDDLKAEQPDLLNPFDPADDDPSAHLEFVVGGLETAKGTVGSKTNRGKQTIEILRLNREALVNRRSEQVLMFFQKLNEEFLKQSWLDQEGVKQERVIDLIRELDSGGPEYCEAKRAAAIVWLEDWTKRQEAQRSKIQAVLDSKNR